jgi:lysophospholipase L1-like esterase
MDALGAAIPTLAESMNNSNSMVRAVDLRLGFNAQGDTYDGVHPNKLGEKKMAAGWLEALKSVLPKRTP